MLKPFGGMNTRALDLQLLTGREYLNKLISDVATTRKGDRILIMTMALDPGEPQIDNLMRELHGAAHRGANVVFGLDAYGRMIYRKYSFVTVPWSADRDGYNRMMDSLNRLAAFKTGSYEFINTPSLPFSNLLTGRSHIKVSIVGNRVYFGGVNLKHVDRLDLMVLIEDATVSDWLYQLCRTIVEHGNVQRALGRTDLRISLDDETGILIDVGRKRRSLILQEAIKIIDEAEDWLAFSCQYLPYGLVADRLEAAVDRGVKLEIYTNHVSHHGTGLMGLPHRFNDARQRRIRSPQLFTGEIGPDLPSMHAKGIANEKQGMGTSHNMVTAGVWAGTAEIGIVRRTPNFALDMRQHLSRLATEANLATIQLQAA